MKHLKNQSGVLLVGVIVMMIVLAIIIPAMVSYVQNESRWTIKEGRNVLAFQLAEAAIDRALKKVSESTTTWQGIQDATTFPAGYMFNQAYSDVGVTGGSYTIGLSSGPDKNQVTIYGIGRYILNKSTAEVRAVKAIYVNAPLGDIAIRSNSTISLTGTDAIVHWGAIVSPKAITQSLSQGSMGRYPQYYGASSVSMDPKGASGQPNCDYDKCHQWWSYKKDIPADAGISTDQYLVESQIVDAANCPTGGTPAGSCYFSTDQTWGGLNTPCATESAASAYYCGDNKVIYVNGNLTVDAGIYVKGTLLVTGNLNLPNGQAGLGTDIDATLPRKAWMQYGNAWTDVYLASKDNDSPSVLWDPTAPAAFPGITSDHMGPANRVLKLDKVMVNGFLYVGGNLTQGSGGGDEKILGAIYVGGTVNVETNNFSVYYSEIAGENIKTNQIILSRKSWKDQPSLGWPTGL